MSERTPYTRTHWHTAHRESSSLGGRIADRVVGAMGSWAFIIAQTVVVALWAVFNIWALAIRHWDAYPFIALNLLFSLQAAYASPLILMASNRAAERDKAQADAQFKDTEETHYLAGEIHKLVQINNELTEDIHTLLNRAEDDRSRSTSFR